MITLNEQYQSYDPNVVIEVAANQEESFISCDKPTEERKTPAKAIQTFNPYVEDVFSAGLTVLQFAYSCSGAEIKSMRTDARSLAKAVE